MFSTRGIDNCVREVNPYVNRSPCIKARELVYADDILAIELSQRITRSRAIANFCVMAGLAKSFSWLERLWFLVELVFVST